MTWLLRNFILALSGNDSPYQLSFGAFLGWCWGFCPITHPIAFAVLVLILLFRVNISLVIAACLCAKLVALPLGGMINELGYQALNQEGLKGMWTALYNTPYIAISGFNEPKIIGGLIMGLIFGVVGFPFIMKFTPFYREHILPKLEKFWVIKLLKGSKLYTTVT